MDTKKSLGILAILVALLVVFGLLRGGDAPDEVANLQVYTNQVFGYGLSYPSDLQIQEYSPDNASFGYITSNGIQAEAEVRVISFEGVNGQTFIDAATGYMKNLCAADSPTFSFSCVGDAEQVEQFISDTGVEGHSFYLQSELRNLADNSTTTVEKGPYFVFPLKASATQSTALVVHPPLNMNAVETDASLLRDIAKSVQIEESAGTVNEEVEAYVRDNISALSPVKEQLGGTFYVTSLTLTDGAGVVSYEDGHNAYTADFSYSSSPAGVVVTDFVIRQQ